MFRRTPVLDLLFPSLAQRAVTEGTADAIFCLLALRRARRLRVAVAARWGQCAASRDRIGAKCLATPRASRSDTKVRGVAGAAAGREVSPDGRRAGLTDTNDPSRPFQGRATPPGNPAIEATAGLLLSGAEASEIARELLC